LRTDSETKALEPPRTLTIGEIVNTAEHRSPDVGAHECLLCEATASVQTGESETWIMCADCGQYVVSAEAARALRALVKYREPARAQMREILSAYRQGEPHKVPSISVKYVVSAGVPTFGFSWTSSRTGNGTHSV
jgi:hypothetical protein